MSNTIYRSKPHRSQAERGYHFQEVANQRWGIYLQGRLLATIGSYEACKSIEESLDKNMSYSDAIKAAIAYKKSIDRSLSIG